MFLESTFSTSKSALTLKDPVRRTPRTNRLFFIGITDFPIGITGFLNRVSDLSNRFSNMANHPVLRRANKFYGVQDRMW